MPEIALYSVALFIHVPSNVIAAARFTTRGACPLGISLVLLNCGLTVMDPVMSVQLLFRAHRSWTLVACKRLLVCIGVFLESALRREVLSTGFVGADKSVARRNNILSVCCHCSWSNCMLGTEWSRMIVARECSPLVNECVAGSVGYWWGWIK